VEDKLDSPASVLVPAGAFREFLNRVGDDKNVVGVLVANGSSEGFESGESDDVQFPQAEFAPYENRSWIWNTVGSGMMQRRFNFPVFLLSPVSDAPVFLNSSLVLGLVFSWDQSAVVVSQNCAGVLGLCKDDGIQ